ncbi:MAG: glycosyltransferase family 39 protein [Acidobacteria bacterium]|nr:glycosyltransferase family 39 protein [Acidobacteriota bacterium]
MAQSRRWFVAALVAGAALRLAILWQTSGLGLRIADEFQYVQLADSLAAGRGFAWQTGELTSLRPPLYPAMLAGIWSIAGAHSFQVVRALQALMTFATAWLVYDVARRLYDDRRTAALAAAVVWLYPALVFVNVTMLTESLFTLLLTAWVSATVRLVQRPSVWLACSCGLLLGLGALTRSVLWPVPLLFCPLLLVLLNAPWRLKVGTAALVFAGYALVVAPWAWRNTRLQGVPTVVDTMSGMNLRMGNYEHTPEDRMWDAVSVQGERSWVHLLSEEQTAGLVPSAGFTEGMKDKWAQRKALEYIRAHPGTFLRRAAIKSSDFWGLDRSFVAGVQQGLYRVPSWFFLIGALVSIAGSALVMLAGAAGIWLVPPAWRFHIALLTPIVVVAGIHSVVFGHPRYHDPLVPVLAIYGAAAVTSLRSRQTSVRASAALGAGLTSILLVGIWVRQIIVVDGERIRALVQQWL